MKTYRGNIEVTVKNQDKINKEFADIEILSGYVRAYQGATITLPELKEVSGYVIADQGATITLPELKEVSGDVRAYQGATITLPELKEVSGYVRADQGATITLPELKIIEGLISVSDLGTEKQLWKRFAKNTWRLNEFSSEWLYKKNGDFEYFLNDVKFSKEWYGKIRFDKLKASQVFAIDNIEHRRIAYQFMDKTKMKELKDFEVLDKIEDDGHGYPMEIVSFTIQKMNERLKFLHVFCPSTGREYYIGTNADKCIDAKAESFGLSAKEVEFVEEW